MNKSLIIILLSTLTYSCSFEPDTIAIIENTQEEQIYLYNSAGNKPKQILGTINTDDHLLEPGEHYLKGELDGKNIGEARLFAPTDSVVLVIMRTDTSYEYAFAENGIAYHIPMNDKLAEAIDTTNYPALKNFSWLLGPWSVLGDSSLVEVWKKESTTKFSGTGYKLQCEADTALIVMEDLQLKYGAQGIQYIAGVNDQNDGKDIRFTSVWDKDTTSIRFEAPEHDFPQVIEYTLLHHDTLSVEVGLISDGGSKYTMRMHRIDKSKHPDCLNGLY